jgi:hypothetical protein
MQLTREWQPITEMMAGRRVGYDYEFRLNATPVEIRVSHLAEARGEMRGEFEVRSIQPGNEGLILRDRMAILSQRSKATLAKAIETRTGKQAMWLGHLEAICDAVLEDARRGEPVVDLAFVEAPDNEEYLVEKMLPLGEPMVLYGDGGSCKSLTALYLAIGVMTKLGIPGLNCLQEPQSVLYLDWETNAAVQHRRLARACTGIGIPLPEGRFFYRRMIRSVADDLRTIRHEVDKRHIGLVIVDSMGAACLGGGDLANIEKSTGVMSFFGALRELDGATKLVVSHINAAEAREGSIARPFGSTYTWNLARSLWFIRRAGAEEADYSKIALSHTKINEGKLFKAIGYRYDFLPDKTLLTRIDPEQDYEISDHLPLSSRISGVLRDGAMTLKELAEELNEKPDSIKKALYRMPSAQSLGGGKGRGNEAKWGLKDEHDDLAF